MIRGTIKTFDRTDGHGDIELEDGRVVRFAWHAIKDKHMLPEPGLAVLVADIAPAFGGLRAALVRDPLEVLDPADKLRALLDRPDARGEHVRSVYRELAAEAKHDVGGVLVQWTRAHPDRLGALHPVDLFSEVPLELLTDDDLGVALDNVARGELQKLDDAMKRFIKNAKARLGR